MFPNILTNKPNNVFKICTKVNNIYINCKPVIIKNHLIRESQWVISYIMLTISVDDYLSSFNWNIKTHPLWVAWLPGKSFLIVQDWKKQSLYLYALISLCFWLWIGCNQFPKALTTGISQLLSIYLFSILLEVIARTIKQLKRIKEILGVNEEVKV